MIHAGYGIISKLSTDSSHATFWYQLWLHIFYFDLNFEQFWMHKNEIFGDG